MTVVLFHGNCATHLAGMAAHSVDLVLCDPPYDLSIEEQGAFLQLMRRVSRGQVILFCSPERQWPEVPDQYLFWVKPISTKNTSKRYSRFVEMILVYGEGTWNTNRHWSQYTNVFQDLVEERYHVFEKPKSLLKRLLLNHTLPGFTVLDPFMGTGTLGVVCKELGRNYIGIEKDAHTFNVAKTRIEHCDQAPSGQGSLPA